MSAAVLGGPLFQPAESEWRKSFFGKEGGHYNIYALKPAGESADLAFLKLFFPKGEANDLNFVLFSTSGIHGSYTTLEEVEASLRKYGPDAPPGDEWPDDYLLPTVTVLLVQPRIVSMTCGNVAVTIENLPFLKRLRETSWAAVREIGGTPVAAPPATPLTKSSTLSPSSSVSSESEGHER